MATTWNWKTISGLVLHILIGGIMILAGSAKVLGLFPPEEVAKLGLSGWITVIGAGELATAVLLEGRRNIPHTPRPPHGWLSELTAPL